MNKFMRLFALLLVVVAIVLVVLAFQVGGHDDKVAQAPSSHPSMATATSAHGQPASYAVVTATAALSPGQAITQQDVEVVQRPYKVSGGFTSVDAVVGKVPAIPVAAGAVLSHHVMLDDLSLKLQPGERAVAVPVTHVSGVAYHVHPGDYVDLFFALKPRTGTDDWKKTQSRLLLPRLRVLAYGSRELPEPKAPAIATSAQKAAQTKVTTTTRAFKTDTAVLAVPLDKVNRILLAQNYGKLSLVLRSPTDPGMPDVKRFPQPAPVLIAKTDTSDNKADPSGDPASSASSADNAAYAGIRLGDFVSGDPKPKRRTTRRRHHYSPPHHRVDIIRGTERSHMTVYDQGGTP